MIFPKWTSLTSRVPITPDVSTAYVFMGNFMTYYRLILVFLDGIPAGGDPTTSAAAPVAALVRAPDLN